MEPQKTPNESILSTLPREKGWCKSSDTLLYKYQGFWYTSFTLESFLRESRSPRWNLSPSHILLCSHPKCGTTWLMALTVAIVTKNHPQDSPLLTSGPHDLIPYLESPDCTQYHNVKNLDLPLFSTHMPYTSLPQSVLDSDCKIIYICRDPKDVFVSRWHFLQNIGSNNGSPTPDFSLDQAFDLFCRGISTFGPYWDHVLEYWKASLDHPEKVLFLKYEDIMRDPLSHVISLAKFMGYPFSNEEEMEGVPLKIVDMCKFESLSNLEVNKSVAKSSIFGRSGLPNDIYFRKGKIGDWRNYLTQDMADKIDQITQMKLGPCGLHF